MSDRKETDTELADRVRRACVAELERAWEEAAIQGLCGEGALEYALDRLRSIDATTLVDRDLS